MAYYKSTIHCTMPLHKREGRKKKLRQPKMKRRSRYRARFRRASYYLRTAHFFFNVADCTSGISHKRLPCTRYRANRNRSSSGGVRLRRQRHPRSAIRDVSRRHWIQTVLSSRPVGWRACPLVHQQPINNYYSNKTFCCPVILCSAPFLFHNP